MNTISNTYVCIKHTFSHSDIVSLAFIVLMLVTANARVFAQTRPYSWSNIAGQTAGGDGNADGPNILARFYCPAGVAVDVNGNLFVADSLNHTIRKVSPTGIVSTFAGSSGISGNADGTASIARFNEPFDVAVDDSGNVYVADFGNHTIRKVTPHGFVTTLAGRAGFPGSADGIGNTARFHAPSGVAVDTSANLYVTDSTNNTVRIVTPAGLVTTLAGFPGFRGSADGAGSAARFNCPYGIAVGLDNTIYVSDRYNMTIRKVTTSGVVTTLAGMAQQYGSSDGTGAYARFAFPHGVAVDSNNNVFVADFNNYAIRKITPAGVVTTFVGSSDISGSSDGIGNAASFSSPVGLALDKTGNLYVAEANSQTIRKVTPAAVVTTLAGVAPNHGSSDGIGSSAQFYGPISVVVDGAGNLFVADGNNHTIRKVTSSGFVTTLAGSAEVTGSADGSGGAATFDSPYGVTVDNSGNLFVADWGNHTIRKITSSGQVTTFAGFPGFPGSADGAGSDARFYNPRGVAVDNDNNVFVADYNNHTIRKIAATGVVTTFAGSPNIPGASDGVGKAARFFRPRGVAVDSHGNVYVADSGNHTIRKVSASRNVTTLAGIPGVTGSMDGNSSTASFFSPSGLAVDNDGNVFVADRDNMTIRAVTSEGLVTTIGGRPGVRGVAEGVGTSAYFTWPTGVSVDHSGNLFVADSGDNRIKKGVPVALCFVGATTLSQGGTSGVIVTMLSKPLSTNSLWSTTNIGAVANTWQLLAIVEADTNGMMQYVDTNVLNSSQKYYRFSIP